MPATIKIEHTISNRRIVDLLIGAFEGGSNYWCRSADIRDQDGSVMRVIELDDHPDRIVGATIGIVGATIGIVDATIGIVDESEESDDDGGPVRKLAMADLCAGLQRMAENHKQHFYDVLDENDDATTADVFLQLATFGKLIYC